MSTFALEQDLYIIPVINKVDLPAADVEKVSAQIINLLGCKPEEIILASGKTGQGVPEILDTIIDKAPAPRTLASGASGNLRDQRGASEMSKPPVTTGRRERVPKHQMLRFGVLELSSSIPISTTTVVSSSTFAFLKVKFLKLRNSHDGSCR